MAVQLVKDVAEYVSYAAIEPITEGQYFRSVRCYSDHLKRPATRDDLREPSVNKWLADIANRMSAFTVLGRKRGLTPVWNWLASLGRVPWYNARALRKTKVAYPPVQAWSVKQVQALLRGAADLEGRLTCGISAKDLMTAYVTIAYETGFRPSDMYRLRWDQLKDGRLLVVQHKTKHVHAVQLESESLRALDPLKECDSQTIFILAKGGIRRWELALFKSAAKYGFERQKRQACGTLRKTHGTEVCRTEGLPSAANSLGHVGGIRVARQSYCEADAIHVAKPQTALINALKSPASKDQEGHRKRA